MAGRLTQPCRVQEEGLTGRKLLLAGANGHLARCREGTGGIRIGELRASSRGNTEDSSVIRIQLGESVSQREVEALVKSSCLTLGLRW